MHRYWIAFSRVKGIGSSRMSALVEAFGDLETAWRASSSDFRAAGFPPRLTESIMATRATLDLDFEIERIEAAGFKAIIREDAAYPVRLKELENPPPVIYQWGEVHPRDRWAIAVVGTRSPTAYGLSVAEDIATELAANGVVVVSELARGIDGAAHRAALNAGGRTIAVLGSGLDWIYPREHTALAGQIAEAGAVLTDYPMGTEPEPHNFPPRNRIISGLSLAVVVVEAGERSGSLITADFAADQGRDVFAVPGDIYRKTSKGTNGLIRSGAYPVTKPEDILEVLEFDPIHREEHILDRLPEDPVESMILEALSREPIHVDELQKALDLPAGSISAALSMLELKGWARQVGGMNFIRIREQRTGYSVD
jgi:DNA processing protein